VQQAIVQLDYRPNVAARAMVTDRTRTFALLVPNLADPNVAAIAAGAEGRARHEGYSMVVAAYSAHAREEGDPDSFFREHRVDGLLLMSPRHFPLDAPALPTATLEEAPVDNADGGRQVGALLKRLGHERVAFIGGPPASPHVRERLRGLAEAVGAPAMVSFGEWQPQSGFALANRWLDGERDATAIFAAGDLIALGVLHALHARGVRVPEDVSVVGFDDTPIAAHTWPRLTTVSQPSKACDAWTLSLKSHWTQRTSVAAKGGRDLCVATTGSVAWPARTSTTCLPISPVAPATAMVIAYCSSVACTLRRP
jgi:LacI family transcriptional regulator/LacI family repressor for deo operon, udp, cdd, tsx, nupC, and nupG